MYNAHWIHSLPYSKFIELTLFNIRILGRNNNFLFFIYNIDISIIKCSNITILANRLTFYDFRNIHIFSIERIITLASFLIVPLCFKAAIASDSLPE